MAEIWEQALFGYEDGHRLLQTSSRLSNYERDLLLQLSDLAPGISRLSEDGYWTGIPLRETSRYALVRTWPAPEMPRPGCVWSHVLLVPFDKIRPLNVAGLIALFQRPKLVKGFKEYSEPLRLGATDFDKVADVPRAEQLVACIYRSECSSLERLPQSELGLQALAIWCQQWPLLQVNFSFRTVEKNSSGRSWLSNFDMMVIEGTLRLQRQQRQPAYLGGGFEEALVAELRNQLPSQLRQFRVDYGEDMPLHPSWTAFLCSVQLTLGVASEKADHRLYREVLREVAASLPERAEGLRLKGALLSYGSSSPFRLPVSFSTDALRFALENIEKSEPHQAILRFVGEVAHNYLNPEFLGRLTTTTALLAFAAMLGFINRETIEAGPLLWAAPLVSAKVDSPYNQLQTLQAFALTLALQDPKPGSEALLEYSFESIHEAMRESRLGYQASIIVEAILPDVKWWRRWDSCHRLRIAVIRAYAYAGLQPGTFFHLTKNEVLRGTLFHELESKDKYRAFLATLQQLSRRPD